MATFNNQQITVVKDNGLVSHVFAETTLRALAGNLVIGHTRYSTSGSANWTAAQPVYRSAGSSGFAIAHNGNLTNTTQLADEAGIQFTSMLSDSDLVAELLAREVESGISLAKALGVVLEKTEGAYSMVVLEADEIHAVRDPYGFRHSASVVSAVKRHPKVGSWRQNRPRWTWSAPPSFERSRPVKW